MTTVPAPSAAPAPTVIPLIAVRRARTGDEGGVQPGADRSARCLKVSPARCSVGLAHVSPRRNCVPRRSLRIGACSPSRNVT